MRTWKEKLSKHMGKSTIKKAFYSALAVAALSLGTGAGTLAEDSGLTTVYYVYVNDNYIGTVSDKKMIEKAIEEKLANTKEAIQTQELTIDSDLTYIPEQVFHANANVDNQAVIQKVNSGLAIQAEASALVIDGKPVAYVKNNESAEQVIRDLKLQYVTEDQLNSVEANKAANLTLPPLQTNETRIVDVRLSKDVLITKEKISPAQIISVTEAVKLLQQGTLEEKKHQVKDGDVLGSIASSYNLDMQKLLSLNPGLQEDSVLKIGQELNVMEYQPYVQVIVDKEQYLEQTIPFETEVVEDSSLVKGDTNVKQEGKEGIKAVTNTISEQNGQTVKQETVKEEILQQPVNSIIVNGTKEIPSSGEGTFVWPTEGGYISSPMGNRWGKMHKGIDIARPGSYTIKAADNGVVVSAGWAGAYGNKIVIDHQNGYQTVYAHLASIDVTQGQSVSRGSKIAVMGSTGDSTGVHLHFELYKNGSLQNPLDYTRQ